MIVKNFAESLDLPLNDLARKGEKYVLGLRYYRICGRSCGFGRYQLDYR